MVMRVFGRSKIDYVAWQGLRLPPKDRRFCTEEWKDDNYYVQSARADVARLQELCGLRAGNALLDLGSGQGRLAIGLILAGLKVSYFGIDVDRASVDWCQRNLAAPNSNLNFLHLDILNDRYNPNGVPFKPPIALPFGSNQVDVVFAYSVFTHMHKLDVTNYLNNIKQLLRPGGTFFFTAYVEDECAMETENPSEYLTGFGSPVGALHRVLFNRGHFEKMIERSGLDIARFDYRSEPETSQSSYILKKPG